MKYSKNTSKNSNKNMGKSSKGSKEPVTAKSTMHLYYMTEINTNISMIMECLKDQVSIVVQMWESMGVAQIERNDKESIDFEDIGLCFKAKEDIQFVEKHNIQAVFEVTLEESEFAFAKQLFGRIVSNNGGFFCTDSDDFAPIYTLSELEA